jgi:hypothetical protein
MLDLLTIAVGALIRRILKYETYEKAQPGGNLRVKAALAVIEKR